MLGRLKTKDRLIKCGLQLEENCVLCNLYKEDAKHLFFKCSFANQCWQDMKAWLEWSTRAEDLHQICRWIRRAKVGKFRKQVYSAVIAGLVYSIWEARNNSIWKGERVNRTRLTEDLKWKIKNRILLIMPNKMKSIDRSWFMEL